MKRVLTIQDISCIGKCSLTVALPILSALGLETAIVPTAVLSTHTQFPHPTFRDLTEDLPPIREHWQELKFKFSAIYTGYLGSARQVDLVLDYFKAFKENGTALIVDPAMADGGKLYAGFDPSFPSDMKRLCAGAEIILPNLSEAALLLDEPYPGEEADPDTVRHLLKGLSEIGARYSIITGVTHADGTFGFSGYDREDDRFFSFGTPKVPMKSHGTGDIFASAFTGLYVRGFSIEEALKAASVYTAGCIRNSSEDPEHVDYAVNFEAELPNLLRLAGIIA
ncbi:MAG: pyridoxamine kinase [Lachnospiraceae bacterium]|nr:pyridoxamine kinase [Lachnospiraceae bacterium]